MRILALASVDRYVRAQQKQRSNVAFSVVSCHGFGAYDPPMTTDRNDPVHRLIALMDLVPDGYPEDVRGPLREARDRAAKHLAAALAPAWTAPLRSARPSRHVR
jgi:hypothetical protein